MMSSLDTEEAPFSASREKSWSELSSFNRIRRTRYVLIPSVMLSRSFLALSEQMT